MRFFILSEIKNPKIWDISGISSRNPKSRNGDFQSSDFFLIKWLIPSIRDFFEPFCCRGFFRNTGIYVESLGFLSRGFGILYNPNIRRFIFAGYPDKKLPLIQWVSEFLRLVVKYFFAIKLCLNFDSFNHVVITLSKTIIKSKHSSLSSNFLWWFLQWIIFNNKTN